MSLRSVYCPSPSFQNDRIHIAGDEHRHLVVARTVKDELVEIFDGNGNLYFFSEREPTDVPPFDPADVTQLPPPNPVLQTVSFLEVGPEGNNGLFYNPAGMLPGDNSAGATYHFVSDVPEPASVALIGLAGALILLRRRR